MRRSRVVAFALCFVPLLLSARNAPPAFLRAIRKGAKAEIRLVVRDDEGALVPGASVRAIFDMPNEEYSLYGKTDTNGVWVVRGKTNGNYVKFLVGKEGYYGSREEMSYIMMGAEHDVKDGKWQPYGAEFQICMKRVKNPQKLSSVNMINYIYTDQIGKWVGYDLEKNDYVRPCGDGVHADFEVFLDWDGQSFPKCKKIGFQLRFLQLYSGYYETSSATESEFPFPYEAVTNAQFVQSARFYDIYDGERIRNTFDMKKCWVVRSRCETNNLGQLISANYSIVGFLGISGSRFGKAGFSFWGAFNPTPNDTNLEDMHFSEKNRWFIRQCEEPQIDDD